ncbi:MAG: VOC family protein [Burkholderiales bacterium]|nr:VOC family protein [Burkholderiales bacterium]
MSTLASSGPAFSHVGFHVRDLKKMEDFYTRVMGFIVTDRGNLMTPRGPVDLVFLSRDPEEHHQVVLASGRPADNDYNLVNQLSFRVPGLAFLKALHQRLQREPGVTEILPATHGNAISVYFRDPEGTRIECFFDTPWYCDQPCREPVDMSLSDAAIMAHSEAIARASAKFQPREAWVAEMRRRMEAGIHA